MEDKKEIRDILYGIVNGNPVFKQKLKLTYKPLLDYISEKYSIEKLSEYENELFKYIEEGINEYLFSNKKHINVELIDPFTIWFVCRMTEYLVNNNIELGYSIEQLVKDKELWSIITFPEKKEEQVTTLKVESINRSKVYTLKKVMSMITVITLAIFILIYNYIPCTYTAINEGIEYNITLNKRVYRKNDDIVIGVELKNISNKTIHTQICFINTLLNLESSKNQTIYNHNNTIEPGEVYNNEVSLIIESSERDFFILNFNYSEYITNITVPLNII